MQADGTQQVIYAAPATVAASAVDVVSYTVSDQHADAIAAGTANVQLNAALTPQTITLPAGNTALQFGQDSGDSLIFAGTSLGNAPTLQFIGQGNNVIGTLTVNGTASGTFSQASGANVEAQGGVQVTGGSLQDTIQQGTTLTLDGSSTISNGGSFTVGSAEQTVNLTGTISLSAIGSNTLDIGGVSATDSTNLNGGTIIQDGENDVTRVDATNGTDFQINAGTLALSGLGGPFQGTIGPISAAAGAAALGIFGRWMFTMR